MAKSYTIYYCTYLLGKEKGEEGKAGKEKMPRSQNGLLLQYQLYTKLYISHSTFCILANFCQKKSQLLLVIFCPGSQGKRGKVVLLGRKEAKFLRAFFAKWSPPPFLHTHYTTRFSSCTFYDYYNSFFVAPVNSTVVVGGNAGGSKTELFSLIGNSSNSS